MPGRKRLFRGRQFRYIITHAVRTTPYVRTAYEIKENAMK